MDIEKILEEMVDIELSRKAPQETLFFSNLDLEPITIRLGCMRILEWLRAQSVALRMRPAVLKPSSRVDAACVRLIEAADFLRDIIQVRGNALAFSENVLYDEARKMMIYVKEHYRPPLFEHCM